MAEQMYNGDLPKSTELMQYAIFNEGQVDGLTTGLEVRNCTVHFLRQTSHKQIWFDLMVWLHKAHSG